MIEWLFWLHFISKWPILAVMLIVVPRRRSPSSAMAWLLVIFLWPWFGVVLYVLIGANRLSAKRIRRHARSQRRLSLPDGPLAERTDIMDPPIPPEQEAAGTLARNLGQFPVVGGNAVEVMTGTAKVIQRLIDDIDAAQQHVHLLFYIYADDETGRLVRDALVRAAERAVQCRVLLDATGSRAALGRLAPAMRKAGIDVRAALPVNLVRAQVARLDLRNHRKIAVIDGRIAYTGSQNIVNPEYGTRRLVWYDMMARLRGPVVADLQAIFANDWFFETDEVLDGPTHYPHIERAGSVAVQVLPSGPNYPMENYQRFVVAALHGARERVLLTTPYFIPDDASLQALQTAAARGARVDLIVPQQSDHPVVHAASRSYFEDVLVAGVNLRLHEKGLLHAKLITIDQGLAIFGTSNFDIRSFELNFEVTLVCYGGEVVTQFQERAAQYISDSTPLDLEAWRRRPWWRRAGQDITRLLSPLL